MVDDLSWTYGDSKYNVQHDFVEGAGVRLKDKVYVMGRV